MGLLLALSCLNQCPLDYVVFGSRMLGQLYIEIQTPIVASELFISPPLMCPQEKTSTAVAAGGSIVTA